MSNKIRLVNNISSEDRLYSSVLFLCDELDKINLGYKKLSNENYEFKKKKVITKFKINNFNISFDEYTYQYEDDLINSTLNNIRKYYRVLDENEILSDEKIKQIGKIYESYKTSCNDKKEIIRQMYEIFTIKNLRSYDEEIKAIISYCIMKCEVLDNE